MTAGFEPGIRRWILRVYRVGLFVFLLLAIHWQQAWFREQKRGASLPPIAVEQVRPLFSAAGRQTTEGNSCSTPRARSLGM
jgi:hypothetical protein